MSIPPKPPGPDATPFESTGVPSRGSMGSRLTAPQDLCRGIVKLSMPHGTVWGTMTAEEYWEWSFLQAEKLYLRRPAEP